MKRTPFALVLVLALGVVSLVGCGGGSPTKATTPPVSTGTGATTSAKP
jgi:hypothetical protein